SLRPVARFPNGPVATSDGLRWNVTELYRNVLSGLEAAIREESDVRSIGVDSWAVDYALLCGDRMLAEPFHYRDERNVSAVTAVHDLVTAADLYRANGLQHLSFNTLFQLTADRLAGALDEADGMLLIPDLLGFWLTGQRFAERTNASTTGLLSVTSGRWDESLIETLGLPRNILPELIDPGSTLGGLLPNVAANLGVKSGVSVTTVGSHDTASAIVAIPAVNPDFAYISCGTWSLVGVELEHPVLTEGSRLAGFTNEGGVDGRIRYLKNVMGLGLLSETVRGWEAEGEYIDLSDLLRQATAVNYTVTQFDVNDPRFLTPGNVLKRIIGWCAEHELPIPVSHAAIVRSILESLAAAYARTITQLHEQTGKTISVIHLVGGGSQNSLLCQLTADHTGVPVIAGPVEATAIGNVLIQGRAHNLIVGDLENLRALVVKSSRQIRYIPSLLRATRHALGSAREATGQGTMP
ncbi:MAG: rhamnulokinase, partial [Kineosporiaceae bacterium]|nr:rhamnulokinase [Aeromicrobium sp.]